MTGRPRAGPEPWARQEAPGRSAAPGALVRSRGPRPPARTLARSPLARSRGPRPPHLATIQPWLIK